MRAKSLQSWWTLCDPMGHSPPDSSLHLEAWTEGRILEWVAISSSRGCSQLRDWSRGSYVSRTGRQVLYHWCQGTEQTAWQAEVQQPGEPGATNKADGSHCARKEAGAARRPHGSPSHASRPHTLLRLILSTVSLPSTQLLAVKSSLERRRPLQMYTHTPHPTGSHITPLSAPWPLLRSLPWWSSGQLICPPRPVLAWTSLEGHSPQLYSELWQVPTSMTR